MKRLNNQKKLDALRKQHDAMGIAVKAVAKAVEQQAADYPLLIKLAVAANNEVPSCITGYAPSDLRQFEGERILLNCALRIKRFQDVEEQHYVDAEGVIDYAKYKALLSRTQRAMLEQAKLRKYTQLNLRLRESAVERAARPGMAAPLQVGSQVVLKRPFVKKGDAENRVGWRVKAIAQKRGQGKWDYVIRNDHTGEELMVPRAHITRLHEPLHTYGKSAAERLMSM